MPIEIVRLEPILGPHCRNRRARKRIRKALAANERMRRSSARVAQLMDELDRDLMRAVLYGRP